MKIWIARIMQTDPKTGQVRPIGYDVKTEPTKGYDCFVTEEAFNELDAENEILVQAMLDMGKLADDITVKLLQKRKEAQDVFLQDKKQIIQNSSHKA